MSGIFCTSAKIRGGNMKKKHLLLIIIALLAFVLPTIMAACTLASEDYSVTVLSPDNEPVSDITVNWLANDKVAGSAKTDENGTATASLAVGTYNVTLDGFAEGLGYTPFSVTSNMREVTVNLSVKKVDYSVTVKDKSGSPAANVTVNWMSGSSIAGSAKTDSNGKAVCNLNYGQYSVMLADLPEGNLYDGAKTVTGANPAVTFELRDGNTMSYKVTVKSEGGLLFKKQELLIYIAGDDSALMSGTTDDNGEYSFSYEIGSYVIETASVPEGYGNASVTLTPEKAQGEIVLHSAVITDTPAANQTYVIGDIIHDYEFTTPYNMKDGKPWSGSIAEILASGKEAIILNNWGLNCSWCVKEMPEMQELYEKYSDKIELIAVNNYSGRPDSNSEIANYYANNEYTFPMMRDTHGFATKFGITGWPYTIVIDRYGAIARIEAGAILSVETWERMVLKYIGDGYVQTFTPGDRVSTSINEEVAKPDVTVPENHYTDVIPNALYNPSELPANTSIKWYPEKDNEYIWPFMIGNDKNVSNVPYLYASNTGKANSMAILYADITVNAGKVLTFEYYADTDDSDILSFVWDGKIVRQIFGKSNGWKTCYLYTDLIDGDHTLGIAYLKDSSGSTDVDNVYIRNLHFVDVSALNQVDQPVDMLRQAAYGRLADGSTVFPYYADVSLDSDGFYHVDVSKLQNSAMSGSDKNPLLLVNLLNVTHWSNNASLQQFILATDEDTGEYLYSCSFDIGNGLRDYRQELVRYLSAAASSDIPGFIPVNESLQKMLAQFMKNVSGETTHDKEWLEACYFYSHYGSGDPIGSPIVGLMPETAIEADLGVRYTVDLTRNVYPFPSMIYTFTPDTDGLYLFKSFISDDPAVVAQYSAQIWLYDDNSSAEYPIAYSGTGRLDINGKDEQNFNLYYRLQANHKYYVELAFEMAERGTYDFEITKVDEDVKRLEPASSDLFDGIFDDEGNLTGMQLAGAIKYRLDTDGFYHAVNEDGSTGDFIYLDVLRANTIALGTIPLYRLVDMYVQDPLLDENGKVVNLDYKFFDFRYCVVYYDQTSGEDTITNYIQKVDLAAHTGMDEFVDYTQQMKKYVDEAMSNTGDMRGLIKVNEELATIINMFVTLRVNGVWAEVEVASANEVTINELKFDSALQNEWLRFCWYYKTYEAIPAENE